MSANRNNAKRRCAAKRAARLRNDALRSVFKEAAQAVTPQARRLNSDFLGVPPSPHKGGAPKNNRNALKHGTHTRARRALFAELNAFIAEGRALLAAFNSDRHHPVARERDPGDPIFTNPKLGRPDPGGPGDDRVVSGP